MAVSARKVQNKRDSNGALTGKPGTVYDVNIKYNSPEGKKTYSKPYCAVYRSCAAKPTHPGNARQYVSAAI